MIQLKNDMAIERPVEAVYAFLTDPKNHPKWDSSSVKMIPEVAGIWRTGMKFDEVRKWSGVARGLDACSARQRHAFEISW